MVSPRKPIPKINPTTGKMYVTREERVTPHVFSNQKYIKYATHDPRTPSQIMATQVMGRVGNRFGASRDGVKRWTAGSESHISASATRRVIVDCTTGAWPRRYFLENVADTA